MTKPNVIIIGNGHYATGLTSISEKKVTDKDRGILLPSALFMQKNNLINEISICGRSSKKVASLKKNLDYFNQEFGWSSNVTFYPKTSVEFDDKAYLTALKEVSKPAVALIAIPDNLHRDVMLSCIKYDVPFLIVKPAVTSLEDFYIVQEEINKKNLLGVVDYHKVFDEANLVLKDEYNKGTYGKLNHVSSLMSQKRDMLDIYSRWLTSSNLNINHYLGSHYIHLITFIADFTPIDVRATAQYNYVANKMNKNIADLIQTHIRWRDETGHIFSSYHVSGWTDPSETEGMTYQELYFLTENGHVSSDQRNRGYKTVLSGKGSQVSNPYFFGFTKDVFGLPSLDTKYGFKSIENFIKAAIDVIDDNKKASDYDQTLPTFSQSEKVTAILAASDLSLENDSCIVSLEKVSNKFKLVKR